MMESTIKKQRRGLTEEQGTIQYMGKTPTVEADVSIFQYDREKYEIHEHQDENACMEFLKERANTWLNVNGAHHIKLVQALGEYLNIHPLTLEDITNTSQRQKFEDYSDYIYV